MLFVDYNPVKSLRGVEGLAFSVITTRSARLGLVSDCSRASQSPLGSQNLMWEWEHSAVLVKYRLVLAARTSLHLIGSVLGTSQLEFKSQSCPWRCNVCGLSFRGANGLFSPCQAVVLLQAAFRGHLSRQKVLLDVGVPDAKSHTKVIVGADECPSITLCLSCSVKDFTSRLNLLNHLVIVLMCWLAAPL